MAKHLELKHRLDRVRRNAAGRRQFDDALRREVVAYVRGRVAQGASKTAATRELGLEQRTVWSWMQTEPRSVVREVEVVESGLVVDASDRTFEVRFASGASVDGLTLDDLAALLRCPS